MTIRAEFYFEDDGAAGIDRVRILTAAGIEVPVPQPSGCPGVHVAETGPVPRTDLPLLAEAVDCAGVTTPVEENGTFFTNETAPVPGPGTPMPCSPEVMCPPDPGCDGLATDATRAYRALSDGCGECARLRADERREREKFWGWFLLGLALLVVAMVLVSQGPWGAIAAIAWVAAGAYLIYEATMASVRADRLARQAEECEDELDAHRDAYDEAIRRIETECCGHCVVVPSYDRPC